MIAAAEGQELIASCGRYPEEPDFRLFGTTRAVEEDPKQSKMIFFTQEVLSKHGCEIDAILGAEAESFGTHSGAKLGQNDMSAG